LILLLELLLTFKVLSATATLHSLVVPKIPSQTKEKKTKIDKDCNVNAIHRCSDLMTKIESTDKFDVVLDFSGYESKWIKDNVEVLNDKVGVYIYISTDSVYEVSVAKKEQRPTKEADAVRPKDKKEVKILAKADNYGHAKLAGEEVLVKQQAAGGFPWVSLRLADVIGPRDTTDRWWVYQMWIQFYHAIGKPIYMPAKVADKIESLTYVEDVAKVVDAVIDGGPFVWNQAYNIAMEEEFSLANILLRMKDIMGVEGVEGDSKESDKSFYNYPTVFGGPIDISKAKDKLGFLPTSAERAFEETIAWYDDAFVNFPEKRDEILREMFEMIIPRENIDNVYREIDKFLASKGMKENKFKQRRKGEMDQLPAVKKDNLDDDKYADHSEL